MSIKRKMNFTAVLRPGFIFSIPAVEERIHNHSGKDLNRTGKQRVKEKEEILSGWTHWNAITASVTLERTDGALDPPHRERLFYKAIITRDSSVSQSEIELPSLLLGQNWGFQQDVGCPDRTHTGPRTRVQNGLQSCVQQQVNGQERLHVRHRLTAGRLNAISGAVFNKCTDSLLHLNSKKRDQCVTGPWSTIISCSGVFGELSSLFFCLKAPRSWCSGGPSLWP